MQVWQIVLITIIAFIKAVDMYGTQILTFNSIIYGALVGLILGDVRTGLVVGGTIQLMSLGVAGLGGASVPDYPTATIIATAIAITTGKGMQAGLAIGLPVGMLGVQLDVMAKIANGFIARKSQAYANRKEFKKMNGILLICPVLIGLTAALPVFVSITLGKSAVEAILSIMPAWFTGGLAIAGKALPVVGVAVLLHFMPVKKYMEYLLIGFVAAAYLKVPMLGVAIIGGALAYALYKSKIKEMKLAVAGGDEDE